MDANVRVRPSTRVCCPRVACGTCIASSRAVRAVFLSVGLLACGTPSPDSGPVPELEIPADTAQSGTRLKLAWWESADGFRTWVSSTDLFDATLGVACTPMRWDDDGITRCAPELQSLVYLDAACTQPVVLGRNRYAADLVASCTELQPRGEVRVSTTEQTMDVTQLWIMRASGCMRFQLPGRTSVNIPDTAPVELAELAIAYQGTGDAAIATYRSEDGLLVPARFEDARYHLTCDLSPLAGADQGPCIADVPVADLFADATCRDPRVAPGCEASGVAQIRTLGCRRYFEVSDTAETPAPLYESSFGCHESNRGVEEVRALGDEIDALRIERGPVPTSTRLAPIYASAASVRFRDRTLWDGELASECSFPPVAADGATASCQPTHGLTRTMYTDADCMQPVAVVTTLPRTDGCVVSAPPAYALGAGNALFHIGQRHLETVYELSGGSACVVVTDQVFDRGQEVQTPRANAVKRRDP